MINKIKILFQRKVDMQNRIDDLLQTNYEQFQAITQLENLVDFQKEVLKGKDELIDKLLLEHQEQIAELEAKIKAPKVTKQKAAKSTKATEKTEPKKRGRKPVCKKVSD